MAEFALGLTSNAVEGALSRVKSAIDEEARIKVRVQNDVMFITGEFQMMQSFLKAANRERANNEAVRTWMTQLRDLAFDVEDCIEFVVHLDKPSTWDWMRRLASSCICTPQPPLPLDMAVNQIQQLKARVEDLSQRNTRYNLINDSGSGSNSHFKPAVTVHSDSATPKLMGGTSSSAFHILSEVWEAAGKKKHSLGDLRRLISGKSSDLEVISLWGSTETAHLGAAYIIRKAYCDPDICQEFKNRAWVKLMHPYNSDEFLESLQTQLYASSCHATHNQIGDDDRHVDLWMTREDRRLIKAELMKQVKEHKYLIVLEGVSTVAEWDAIKMYLPDSKKGSRVIVSTEQLGIALLCPGEPYRVSELSRFSDDQSLCAILTKRFSQRLSVGELMWQISCRGVISVWGGKSIPVNQVFDCITLKWKELDGVDFKRHSWVDVPNPFDLNVFSRRLLVNFYSDDFESKEIAAVGITGVTERCCRFLREDDCLVVINGLESTGDWDLIKATFLSEPIKGCILVIVHEENVATHCVDHYDTKVFSIKDLEDDVALGRLIKGCEYNGFVGRQASHRARFFSKTRIHDALNWLDKFEHYKNRVTSQIEAGVQIPGVISLWGTDSADLSAVVRLQYCSLMTKSLKDPFLGFCWVDVPCPFNLTEFCWRLLLDYLSDNLEAKDILSVDMMKGNKDIIQECREFLRELRCLVVIDALRSMDHWDLIRDACLSEPIRCCIIVITNQERVATHCVDKKEKAFHVEGPEADVIHRLFEKEEMEGFYSKFEKKKFGKKERREEAREWMDNFELVGRHNEWDELNKHLKDPCVICLSGMAGVGKSALVRSIYYFQMLPISQDRLTSCGYSQSNHQDGFSGYSWVDVPQPFNLTEFCWRLLLDFYSDDLQGKETRAVGMIESQDPVQGCVELLGERRCFVVVDGLRSTEECDLIKAALLSEHTKASIFIITNELSVAALYPDNDVVTLKGLEARDALSLFEKKLKHGEQLTPREMEVSNIFVAKCGGIPPVIHATAEYVAKLEDDKCVDVLESFSNGFGSTLKLDPRFHSLKGLFSWMQSYFDTCSDSVKPCVFYLSVFPAEHNIRCRRLLRRWVAEGYSRDTTVGISAEVAGKKLFSELVRLNIIQQLDNGVMYQVNGFFLEYLVSQPMVDNRVFALEGHCSPNSQRGGQHLTIMRSWDRDKIVFESIDLARLRSLTVFGEWRSFFIPMADSTNMRMLRVLDIQDTWGLTDGDIEQIGILLPRLKFLSLRGCIEITCLPSSLGDMRQLQTLDIKNTSIISLPPAIIKLQKLQYVSAGTTVTSEDEVRDNNDITHPSLAMPIDGSTLVPLAGDDEVQTPPATRTGTGRKHSSRAHNLVVCCSTWLPKKLRQRQPLDNGGGGVEVPAAGIGNLAALHTLGVVNVGVVGGAVFLKELKKLTQLRKLRVCSINRGNWHYLCAAISCQAHLETLSVRLNDEQHLCCLDDISKPPKKLESLKLYGGNTHVSLAWMKNLQYLRKAHLEDLELRISTQEDIDNLMQLQCQDMYRRLCVKLSQDGDLHYGCRDQSILWRGKHFTASKTLKIDCGCYRSKIVFGYRTADNVEVMVVHCSTTEASLEVFGLDKLYHLKEVRLEGFYSDALKQHLQQKIDELPSPRRVVLKLEDSSPC